MREDWQTATQPGLTYMATSFLFGQRLQRWTSSRSGSALAANGSFLVALSATVADLAKTIDFDDVVGYSITLSARTNNAGGTVTPIALAVLRLITSSNWLAVRLNCHRSRGRAAYLLN